jgi:hypothetical protein
MCATSERPDHRSFGFQGTECARGVVKLDDSLIVHPEQVSTRAQFVVSNDVRGRDLGIIILVEALFFQLFKRWVHFVHFEDRLR